VETRVKQENFLKIVVSMLPGWEMINNYSAHILGMIWVCWDLGISSLKALDIHEQVITCQVDSVVTGSPWALFVVYGATQGLDRRDLLQRLNFLKFSAGCLPWLIAGDFNVVRTTQEKWGSASLTCYEKEFQHSVFSLEVDDLAYSCFFHTWTNKQAGSNVGLRKLDRVMANVNWLQHYGNTPVDFLERSLSDHSPSLVSVTKYVSYRPKPFKFFKFWVEHAQFLDWVDEGWKIEVTGYAMFRLYSRLNL
jgi:hypothetical protein